MNNRLRNILCSTLLLTLPMASLAKEKAENDSVCRPLFTAFEINVGGASDIPESYTRYLRRGLATALKWEHLPIVIEYDKAENPYD